MKRLNAVMTKVVVFAACALAVWTSPAQATATRVDITSAPEGAAVEIDGEARGATPVTFYDLKPGVHRLKYRLPGYEDCDQYFTLVAGQPQQRSAMLDEQSGILLLKSDPEGAQIEIDGSVLGVTPRLVTTLGIARPHRVTLSKAGYRPSAFDLRFDGRKPVVRTESLVLDSGVVDVISDPAGAEVTVNGIVRGRTPLQVSGVPKGRATVRLRLDGYGEEVRELAVNAGDRETLSVVMKGLPGTLSLVSLPEGARFYVNGEYRGKSPVSLASLKPGSYQVRAELDGYGTLDRTIELANGASAREEFRLSNVMGRIELRTAPAGAQILLDGRTVGVTSSKDPQAEFSDVFSIEKVMAGEHVVTIRMDGYAEEVRHPKVEEQKTQQAKIRLRRIFTPNVEIVTETGTFTGVLIHSKRDIVTVEVSPGITRGFPRESIRKLHFIEKGAKAK